MSVEIDKINRNFQKLPNNTRSDEKRTLCQNCNF